MICISRMKHLTFLLTASISQRRRRRRRRLHIQFSMVTKSSIDFSQKKDFGLITAQKVHKVFHLEGDFVVYIFPVKLKQFQTFIVTIILWYSVHIYARKSNQRRKSELALNWQFFNCFFFFESINGLDAICVLAY